MVSYFRRAAFASIPPQLYSLLSCLKKHVTCNIVYWISTKTVEILQIGPKGAPPEGSKVLVKQKDIRKSKKSSVKPQALVLRHLACDNVCLVDLQIDQLFTLSASCLRCPRQRGHFLHTLCLYSNRTHKVVRLMDRRLGKCQSMLHIRTAKIDESWQQECATSKDDCWFHYGCTTLIKQ